MGADPTSFLPALDQVWTEKRIAEQLYNENPILSRIKRLNKTQIGDYAKTTIHKERNWGFTTTPNSGGTLNTAGQQGFEQAKWYYTHQHVQVSIQGSAIDESAGDAQALASVVDTEVTGAVDDLNRQLTRQLVNDGTAQFIQCGTTTAANVVVLTDVDAIPRGWIGVGAVVNIGTTADSDSIASARNVTAVDETNNTITIDGAAVTTTSSHYISFYRSTDGTATSYEMNGLDNIVGTATLGGLSSSSVPVWKASRDATSQALTLSLMYQRNQKVQQKTGKVATYVATGLKQQRKAYELAAANVRYLREDKLPTGSVDAVDINGVSLFGVPDIRDAQMFFLTIEDFLLVTQGDPYWQNKITGGEKLVWSQGTDAYVGKVTTRLQLGVKRRNSHSSLVGLT